MSRNKEKREELSFEARAVHGIESIAHSFKRLVEQLFPPATAFTFISGGSMPTNFTVVPGQSGQVTATPNGALQAGNVPVWTVDDPSVSLTPDPTGLVIAFATSAADPATGFTLTINGVNSAGVSISSSQLMTFTPSGPTPATGFTFAQNS